MRLSQETIMQLIELITNVMHALNDHNLKKMKKELITLKKFSNTLPQKIKDDIQAFIIQSDIQKDYDITHGVSQKLKQLADQIVHDLKKFYI